MEVAVLVRRARVVVARVPLEIVAVVFAVAVVDTNESNISTTRIAAIQEVGVGAFSRVELAKVIIARAGEPIEETEIAAGTVGQK